MKYSHDSLTLQNYNSEVWMKHFLVYENNCCKLLECLILSNDFCHLLTTFANILDPDTDWQNQDS